MIHIQVEANANLITQFPLMARKPSQESGGLVMLE